MSTTIEIPGGTAVLRGPSELRGRDRQLIQAAAMAAAPAIAKLPPSFVEAAESQDSTAAMKAAQDNPFQLTRSEALALLELKECCAVAMLESWTLPQLLPTADTIGDLSADLHQALCDAAGGVDTSTLLATDFGSSSDEESPTTASES